MIESTASDIGAIYQSAWARISSVDDCPSAARATTSSRFIHSAANLATKVRKFAFFLACHDCCPGKRPTRFTQCDGVRKEVSGEVLGEVECKVLKSHFLSTSIQLSYLLLRSIMAPTLPSDFSVQSFSTKLKRANDLWRQIPRMTFVISFGSNLFFSCLPLSRFVLRRSTRIRMSRLVDRE